MKHFVTRFLTTLILLSTSALAVDGPLPFGVTIGGQTATYKEGQPYAQVEKPVTADAAITVDTKEEVSIINVNKTGADGDPDPAAQPAIILLQGTNKGSLAQTVDKQKLGAGKYLISITSGELTATIKFEIK